MRRFGLLERILICAVVVLLLVIAFVLRERSRRHMDLSPDAERAIERAKHH